MTRETIGAALIVRNGGEAFAKCLASLRGQVDAIFVTLTEPDQSSAIYHSDRATAEAFGATCSDFPWVDDFAAARNANFATVTTDWILWIDADDVLSGDLRALVASLPASVGGVWLPYQYAHIEGQPAMVYDRERVVRRSVGWTWDGPVHETLAAHAPVQWARSTDVQIVHCRDTEQVDVRTSSIDRNRRILLDWHAREPERARVLWYLGMGEHAAGEWRKAIDYFERYAAVSDVPHEKWQALCYQARSYAKLTAWRLAMGAAFRALGTEPRWPDPYLVLAECAINLHQPEQALWYLAQAEQCDPVPPYVFQNPLAMAYDRLVFKQLALSELGYIDDALAICNEALAILPNDRLLADKAAYETHQRAQKSLDAALWLYEDLSRNNESLKARDLHRCLPYTIRNTAPILECRERVAAQVDHLSSSAAYKAFYTDNPHWEPIPDDIIDEWCEALGRITWIRDRLERRGAKRVLDVGCSDGFISIWLARQGYEVVGVDIDPRCVDLANERARREGLPARFICGMFEELDPDELGHFDAALVMEVLEHVETPQYTLACAERVADAVLITVPNGAFEQGAIDDWDKPEPQGHVRVFSQHDLEVLLGVLGRNLIELHPVDTRWLVAEYDQRNTLAHPPVSIYCGPGLEQWGPWSVGQGGIGGSETAVVEMAQALRAHDLRVTVHGEAHGVYEGVVWRHYSSFTPRDLALWVSWRNPQHIGVNAEGSAEQSWLWVHDWLEHDVLTPELAARYDKILVLSESHRAHMAERYPFAADRLVVTANGINPDRFAHLGVLREPHRYIWSNSPDRGLDVLLRDIWPAIRAAQPDAELHVCYGLDNAQKLQQSRPGLRTVLATIADNLTQPGVVYHGRLDQHALAEQFGLARAWLYPAWTDDKPFQETYCITAIEAQAAGCVPVTARYGALAETVRCGPVVETLDPAAWVAAVTSLEQIDPADVSAAQTWARGQTWQSVAAQWVEWLHAPVPA